MNNGFEDTTNLPDSLAALRLVRDNHRLWHNPLLLDCERGILDLEDFRYIFSQYYCFSWNFTKLLAGCMLNCDNDFFRAKLSANLWEEGGGADIEKRHAELFRKFLTQTLNINLDEIKFDKYTKYFFDKYLDLCTNHGPIVSSAALSFGTEGVIAPLYKIFVSGLRKIGIGDDQLKFFLLHIDCDDEHAETLEEIMISYQSDKNWLAMCEKGVLAAMELTDEFFCDISSNLYTRNRLQSLQHKATDGLINRHPNKANLLQNSNKENRKSCMKSTY